MSTHSFWKETLQNSIKEDHKNGNLYKKFINNDICFSNRNMKNFVIFVKWYTNVLKTLFAKFNNIR